MTKAILAALLAALTVMSGTSAAADPPQPLADRPEIVTEHREGISNAVARGIFIDPRVESLMARAPVGTCLNDPTLPKCPPARAVIYSDSNEYGPTPDQASAPGSITTMQAYLACRVNLDPNEPYKVGNAVYGRGVNYCDASATAQEVYVELQKYDINQAAWRAIDTDTGYGVGGQTISARAGSVCNSTPIRAWRNRVTGYGNVRGVWYSGQEGWVSANRSCNYP